jgi:hypothetical protein
MLLRITILWVLGLLTAVPYAIYRLLFIAPREEYAFLIVFPLFWIFGFWGVVAPLLMAVRVRRFFRALEQAPSREELQKMLHSGEAEDLAIELIATENRIPKFLARRLLRFALNRLARQTPQLPPSGG